MFERFTKDARRVVTDAQAHARALRHPYIGTDHLLLALSDGDDIPARVLTQHGLDGAGIRDGIARMVDDPLDPEALSTFGIDLDAVRAATERTFGEGALDAPAGKRGCAPKRHIRFTPRAKKALELSLRHALRLKHNRIGSGHILLGVLHDEEFGAARLAAELGADVEELRADVVRLLTSEAA